MSEVPLIPWGAVEGRMGYWGRLNVRVHGVWVWFRGRALVSAITWAPVGPTSFPLTPLPGDS